ncbi:hypothetical protein L7F22_064280 [Adiantum nelumboides]|nr:hypothetical protein [Adiantum nelumboides]
MAMAASMSHGHFEEQVRSSKKHALLVAGLQLASRFLGFCALTWATVVLLGGFAAALRLLGFYVISILLLLEGARLFIVHIFSKLLSRALFRELHRPEDFQFIDRQAIEAVRLDLMGQGLSLLLAAASLTSAIVRLSLTAHGHPLSENTVPASPGRSRSNLPASLRIFYAMVICNSTSAFASSSLRPLLRPCYPGNACVSLAACLFRRSRPCSQQDSLMCFHDEVYKTAIEMGLPEAERLEILEFGFTKLASDYKRNIRPPLIRELNKDLIQYMYNSQYGMAWQWRASIYMGETATCGSRWRRRVCRACGRRRRGWRRRLRCFGHYKAGCMEQGRMRNRRSTAS